jgi:hypothetical protein
MDFLGDGLAAAATALRATVSISSELHLPVACSRKTPPSIEQGESSI